MLFPDPKRQDQRRNQMRAEKNRRDATYLFERGRGNQLPGAAGSLWGAYSGVTEPVDHG